MHNNLVNSLFGSSSTPSKNSNKSLNIRLAAPLAGTNLTILCSELRYLSHVLMTPKIPKTKKECFAQLDEMLSEEERQGKARADYGTCLKRGN